MEEFDDISKELDGIAPMLNRLPKNLSFKVEDNYFDELPTRVMERVHAANRRSISPSWAWLLQPRWAAAMGVAMVAIVFGTWFMFRPSAQERQFAEFVQKPLPKAEVQKLLEEPATKENILEHIDSDEMAEAVRVHKKDVKKDLHLKKQADIQALREQILNELEDSASIMDEL